MTETFQRPLIPSAVLKLFRERYNTWDIVGMFVTSEPRVLRALHEILDKERASGIKRKPVGSHPLLGRLGPEG